MRTPNIHGGESPGSGDDMDHDAAWWDARLRSTECSQQQREEFQRWIAADADHLRDFERLQLGVRRLQLEAATHPHLRAMRNEAAQSRRHMGVRRSLVAGSVLIVSLASWLIYHNVQAPTPAAAPVATLLQTSAGERSTARLADGTHISLDTKTRVEVAYTPELRSIVVEEGRAWFSVAKDASRPFTVEAGAQQIVAVGTEFDVRLDEQKLLVTLIEGRVNVVSASAAGSAPVSAQSMNPGEQLVVDRASGATTIGAADVMRATSWRHGKIIFEDTPLAEAVSEMNRYSTTPIVLVDPDLAGVLINGMFYTARPESFVLALQRYFSIEVRVSPRGTTELIGRSEATSVRSK